MKTNSNYLLTSGSILIAAAAIALSPTAFAETANFQSGTGGNYTGLTDTYVDYQGDVDANWGARGLMLAFNDGGGSQKTSLLNFDLTSISGPVTVDAATLSIYVEGNAERTGLFSQTFNVYSILRSGLDYGTSDGVAETGAVSFAAAAYDPTTPIGWGTANIGTNGPVAGEDYSASVLGTFTLTSANVSGARVLISLDNATVGSWINTPSSNNGLIITAVASAGDQAIIYSSAENSFFAPAFDITYTAVPEPGVTWFLGMSGLVVVATRVYRRRSQKAQA